MKSLRVSASSEKVFSMRAAEVAPAAAVIAELETAPSIFPSASYSAA